MTRTVRLAGVYGQRYDNSGSAVGSEFRVNSYTTGDQRTPTVAMDGAGDFVVVWRGAGPTAVDGVFARRYNNAGTAQGAETQVNTTANPNYPAVAMDKAGAFAVVWEGYPAGGSGRDTVARRFDSAGTALGPEFRVNTYTSGNQFSPAIGMDPAGNFLVAWESPAGWVRKRHLRPAVRSRGQLRRHRVPSQRLHDRRAAAAARGDVHPWRFRRDLEQPGPGR